MKLVTRCLERSVAVVMDGHRQLPSQIVRRLVDWDYATMPLVKSWWPGRLGRACGGGARQRGAWRENNRALWWARRR